MRSLLATTCSRGNSDYYLTKVGSDPIAIATQLGAKTGSDPGSDPIAIATQLKLVTGVAFCQASSTNTKRTIPLAALDL